MYFSDRVRDRNSADIYKTKSVFLYVTGFFVSALFRILKKRKEEMFFDECADWRYDDIKILTGAAKMQQRRA